MALLILLLNKKRIEGLRKPQYHAHIDEHGKAIWVDILPPYLVVFTSVWPNNSCTVLIS